MSESVKNALRLVEGYVDWQHHQHLDRFTVLWFKGFGAVKEICPDSGNPVLSSIFSAACYYRMIVYAFYAVGTIKKTYPT